MRRSLRLSLRLMITDYLLELEFGKIRIIICRRENLCKLNFFNSESDIQALEILKNQNLLVLGTEGIEINVEVHDNSELKGGEDLEVKKVQSIKIEIILIIMNFETKDSTG